MIDETELFEPDATALPLVCTWATVGHPGDPDVVSLGADENDGVTLVKVTLKHGAPTGKPMADDGGFNGQRIVAQVGAPSWDTPARGARVVVMFPDGDIQTPGNGVIVFRAGTSPTRRFGRRKTVMDFTGKDVVIIGKSVTLIDDTAKHFVNVGVNGAKLASSGSGFFVKNTDLSAKVLDADGNVLNYLVANSDDISLVRSVEPSNPTTLALTSQGVEMGGQFISCDFITAMKLGKNASPASPVLLGPSGPAGAPSTCIWGAIAP